VGRLRERERELAAVELLLARGGGVLVVEGRAGIGNTALAGEAGRRAAELGHKIVRARGSELEAGFAFGVVRQLFERCSTSPSRPSRATWHTRTPSSGSRAVASCPARWPRKN
jgi:hypothetical protein